MSYETVLVTGSSQGIGYAIVEELGTRGHTVYASCRQPLIAYSLQRLAERISSIKIIPLDVTSQPSIDNAAEKILIREGGVDAIIHNAGLAVYGPPEMHTIDEIHRIFDCNVYGPMRVNQAFLPMMRQQGYGKIIYVGSISGAIPSKNMPFYAASKTALESIGASEAYHLKKSGTLMSILSNQGLLRQILKNTLLLAKVFCT